MVSDGDRDGLVLGRVGCVGYVGCDLCRSGFWVSGWQWVDFNRCDFGGQRHGQWMQRHGSSGATTWAIGATAWVWFSTVGCPFFFFFYGRLWVAAGSGGGVKCVQCVAMVVIVVLEQKERERKNK